MRRFIGHFRKPHVPAHGIEFREEPTAIEGQQMRLPTELLILVASHVHAKADLLNLYRASKEFRRICMPLLYRVIDAYTQRGLSSEAKLCLYNTLQDPNVAYHVTEILLELKTDSKCTKQWRLLPRKHDCACDSYDRALGRALRCLHNLRVLVIICRLCRGSHTHDYLPQLEMPELTGLQFRCYGCNSSMKGNKVPTSILLAPFLRNVSALDLDCNHELLCGSAKSHVQLLQIPDILPNVRILNYDGCDFCLDLLAARPIERFCVLWKGARPIHDAIVASPGRLSHILATEFLALVRFALPTLEPYIHLRHVGTLTFANSEENLVQNAVEILAPLKKLEVIEINQMTLAGLEPGSEESLQDYLNSFFTPSSLFITLLGEQHPKLRLVYFVQRYNTYSRPRMFIEAVLWEKGSRWIPQPASYFTYWDILLGKMDEL